MKKLHDLKYVAPFLIGLMLIAGCAPPGEETEELAVTHEALKYTFPGPDADANDFHIEFDQENVKTKDMGPFNQTKTEGKIINLKKSGDLIPANSGAGLEFERDGDFNILKWWWTFEDADGGNHVRVGDVQTGAPR